MELTLMQRRVYDLDASLTHSINAWAGRSLGLDQVMIWVSAVGVPLLVLAVAAQWWRREERQRTRHVLVAAGLSFLLGLALNQFVLLFVHRIRPYDGGLTHLLIAPSQDFSFPSDHTTATIAIAATFILHEMRRVGFGFLVATLLVGFSRVYLGTHYASDVLGGLLTGTVAAIAVRHAFREGTRADQFVTRIL